MGYNVRVSKLKQIYRWLSIVGPSCLIVALGCYLLPLFTTFTPYGERIDFYGFWLIFGGQRDFVLPSGVYSFTARLSLYLLIVSQCLLLGAAGGYLSRHSAFNARFSALLAIGAVVGISMTRFLLSFTMSVPQDGFFFGYGFYLALCFAALGLAIVILANIFQILVNRSKKSEKPNEKTSF